VQSVRFIRKIREPRGRLHIEVSRIPERERGYTRCVYPLEMIESAFWMHNPLKACTLGGGGCKWDLGCRGGGGFKWVPGMLAHAEGEADQLALSCLGLTHLVGLLLTPGYHPSIPHHALKPQQPVQSWHSHSGISGNVRWQSSQWRLLTLQTSRSCASSHHSHSSFTAQGSTPPPFSLPSSLVTAP